VAVIFLAFALPGLAEGLARVASCDEVHPSVDASVKLPDVSVTGYTWEAL
jgi:hypothetical protein